MEAAGATQVRTSIVYARRRWRRVAAWFLAFAGFAVITTVYRVTTLSSAFPSSWRLSIGDGFEYISNKSLEHVPWAFDWTRIGIGFLLRWDSTILTYPPWPALALVFLIVAYRAAGFWVAVCTLAAVMFTLGVGLWTETMQSLALITVSVAFSVAIGLALGILTARKDRLFSVLEPVLDGMQTIPVFVYLIPALFAFGTGDVPSAIVTIIYAVPPTVRLTNLGIRQVPSEIVDAARAYGGSRFQVLWKVELPVAKPAILMGINQTVMMALSMLLIAAMIGANGLGQPVWQSVMRLEVGQAFEAGAIIVFLAILIDRVIMGFSKSTRSSGATTHRRLGFWRRSSSEDSTKPIAKYVYTERTYVDVLRARKAWIACAAFVTALIIVDRTVVSLRGYPSTLEFSLRGSVDRVVDWIQQSLDFILTPTRDFISVDIVIRLNDWLANLPWPSLVLALAIIAFLAGGFRTAAIVSLSIILIGLLGVWPDALLTATLVGIATGLAIVIGIPLGILMSTNKYAESLMRPILDTMQTLPVFLFVIPAIIFFGIGSVAAIFATVINAMPPIIRMTNLGIREVETEAVEAAQAFGSSRYQLLRKIRLPLALPSIMVGVNQTTMMALAMVIVSAFIGAEGTGTTILRALGEIDLSKGFNAGLAVLLLAVIFDSITQGWGHRRSTPAQLR